MIVCCLCCDHDQNLSSTGDHFSLIAGLNEDNKKYFDDSSRSGKNVVSVAQWKQLRDKFHALQIEMQKWLIIRDELGLLIDNIITSFRQFYDSWSEDDQLIE